MHDPGPEELEERARPRGAHRERLEDLFVLLLAEQRVVCIRSANADAGRGLRIERANML